MAQIIKHRRGGISNLPSTVVAGEILVVTGSGDFSGPIIMVGTEGASDYQVPIAVFSASVTEGSNVGMPENSGSLAGSLIYDEADTALYRVDDGGLPQL